MRRGCGRTWRRGREWHPVCPREYDAPMNSVTASSWLSWIGLRLLGGAIAGLSLGAAVHIYCRWLIF